jgi:predicted phage tail protein
MKRVLFHGLLKSFVGPEASVRVESLDDVYKFLKANSSRFEKKMRKLKGMLDSFLFIADGEILQINSSLQKILEGCKVLEIIPVLSLGGKVLRMVLGAVAIIVGAILIYTGVWAYFGYVLISVGISLFITALMSPKSPKQTRTASYLFSSSGTNVAARNTPIPLGYGRLSIGSLIIGAAIYNKDLSLEAKENS